MSDTITPQELEKLLQQLQGQDLEAIGRRLGLDLHGADKDRALAEALAKSAQLREQVKRLALTRPQEAQCSFCGCRASDQRKVVASAAGAKICSVCLQGFQQ